MPWLVADRPATDSWNPSDLIGIADPQLNLGPGTTAGTFATVLDANVFSNGWNLNAASYVTAPIQIGGSNFQLLAGDLLLSPEANGTIFTSNNAIPLDTGFQASVTANNADLVVFRPDTAGDYTQGQFGMLLEDVAGGHWLQGITLIEQDITVGGYALQAGDFLYSCSNPSINNNIWLYETGTTGFGATPVSRQVFLAGDDAGVGIGNAIHGIELLETTNEVGGQVLDAGTLLVNVDAAEAVGSNGLSIDRFDVFSLKVSTSSLVGVGQATAQILFDGSHVAFNSNEEDLDALTLAHQVTVVANNVGTVTIDNMTPAQGDTLTANVVDPDGATGAISYQWYRGASAIVGATSSTYTTVQTDVGSVISVTATYTDDLGAAETPTSAATAAVTNVNQTPVVNDQTLSVDENAANGTLVGTVTATDSGPADNYTMLYWVDVQTDELRRINLDGTGNEQLALQADGTAATGMRSVAVDDVNGKVYWVNNNSDQIWRANLDGSSPEQILSGIAWPMGIAVDAAGEKIYWFDNTASELWWADLDGANAAALITAGINHPKALAIDAIGGKLYWTDWGLKTIMRANLDGSNLETVVAGLDDPYGIALDTPAGKVYWAEARLGEIQRADMVVGATAETVITGLSEPRAVTVDTINGKLYYADAGVDRIERANLDGSAIEIVTATGDWPTGRCHRTARAKPHLCHHRRQHQWCFHHRLGNGGNHRCQQL